MTALVTLKVIHPKSGKELAVLKNVSNDETVAELKEKIHAACPKLYPGRVSLRTGSRSKGLADGEVVGQLALQDNKIYLKDLGPQVGWTTVFMTEYTGPLVCYLILYLRPSIIYGSEAAAKPMLECVRIAMACHTFHYVKRLFETIFVHRFSKATMPIMNIFKNSFYYWGFAAWMSYYVNHPLYTPVPASIFYPALAAFAFCELGNLSIHVALRNLRPPGTRVRAIPKPGINPYTWLFGLVSCPNYTYEFGAWLSFSLMTGTVTSCLFTLAGVYQMTVWALGKHRNYRKEFSNYPRSRKAIIPFLL
ncbi:very-long-chain enoyl-CoA reductase-like [Watersipora subatra]|uniref:very-long-chain enoyl-CoA reductase-like n=1 Tax=Watersipora subatra TaxID=2589382 RepID=UPI00355B6646